MTPNEVVKIAAKALSDKKGKDIKVLKTDKLTSLCDYFIICTGTSSTHIKTLTDEIDKAMSEAGEPPIRRDFYKLEHLWSDAEEIDLSSLIGPC